MKKLYRPNFQALIVVLTLTISSAAKASPAAASIATLERLSVLGNMAPAGSTQDCLLITSLPGTVRTISKYGLQTPQVVDKALQFSATVPNLDRLWDLISEASLGETIPSSGNQAPIPSGDSGYDVYSATDSETGEAVTLKNSAAPGTLNSSEATSVLLKFINDNCGQ